MNADREMLMAIWTAIFENDGDYTFTCTSPNHAISMRHRLYRFRKSLNQSYLYPYSLSIVESTIVAARIFPAGQITLTPPSSQLPEAADWAPPPPSLNVGLSPEQKEAIIKGVRATAGDLKAKAYIPTPPVNDVAARYHSILKTGGRTYELSSPEEAEQAKTIVLTQLQELVPTHPWANELLLYEFVVEGNALVIRPSAAALIHTPSTEKS